MSFGMRIWGADGALQLDENSFTVRVVYSALVTASGASLYIPISEVSPTTHTGFCIPATQYSGDTSGQDSKFSQFDVQILSGGVTVWFRNRNFPTGRVGTGSRRLLVFRYR
jgi:hypothetical protein